MNNSNKKSTWFPTPRYICRKKVVFDFLSEIKKGTVLEIGVGAGDLVYELAKKGYKGLGIEISDEAVEISRRKISKIHNNNIKIEKRDLFEINESFDIVIILEVIEHIKDDEKALKKICDIINDGGHLIISAPAHKKDWSFQSDELAGHYRRYEKNEIKSKLEKAGFEALKLYNYGFPIANIARPIRNYLMKKDSLSSEYERMNTKRSGIDRNSQKKFAFMINRLTMAPFLFLQKLFFNRDWGDGYIMLARKK